MSADIFHVGHLNLIKRAKTFGDYLIVGVHSDKDISKYKRKPIISEQDRYEIIRSCKYVDDVIEAAPLMMTEKFIKYYNIDLVVRGDDVTEEHLRQQAYPIKANIIRYVPRTKGISTTEIMRRIKNEKNKR
tara:strand:+ start:64 stop:456 length:393 start_codon:yes stop_codon:yes gene_type:complete